MELFAGEGEQGAREGVALGRHRALELGKQLGEGERVMGSERKKREYQSERVRPRWR